MPNLEIHMMKITSPEELESVFDLLMGASTKQDKITDEERQLSFSYLARAQSAKDLAELDMIGREVMELQRLPHNMLLPERHAHYEALIQAMMGLTVVKFGLEALRAYDEQRNAENGDA